MKKKRTRKMWTKSEIALLRKLYPTTTGSEIERRLGRTPSSVYGMAAMLGLKKDPVFLYEQNRDIGLKAANHPDFVKNRYVSGKRMPGQAKPNGQLLAKLGKATRFKKGNVPATILYDGAITTRWEKTGHRGRKRPIQFIRIAKGKWEYLHVHLWKQKHGPVPKGHRVMFKDRDSMNVKMSNLVLRTYEQAMREIHLSDEYIAARMAAVTGGRGKYDRKLAEQFLANKALIAAKRHQLLLSKKTGEAA